MNLNNVFTRTLLSSLGVGFLIFFLGLPLICVILFLANNESLSGIDSFIFLIALFMYIVYWPIQISLSMIHLIMTRYWERTSKPGSGTLLQSFLMAEWLLYMLVFVFVVWILDERDGWLVVLAFSLPYVVACTYSVYLYKRNYEQELAATPESTIEIQ